MKAAFVRIAASKSADPDVLSALHELEALAHALEEADAAFPEKIKASKAKRGESVTKLSRSKQQELGEYETDQHELDRQIEFRLSQLQTAHEVIEALHFGLSQHLPNDRRLLRYYHPDERSLGEKMVALKERLVETMAAFMSDFPNES